MDYWIDVMPFKFENLYVSDVLQCHKSPGLKIQEWVKNQHAKIDSEDKQTLLERMRKLNDGYTYKTTRKSV